jgi:hypothetical protein
MPQFVIEIAGPKNENVIFSPTRTKVRGRWDNAKTMHRDRGEAMKKLAMAAPSIPGKCILLDTDKMVGEIFDPLKDTREGQVALQAIKQVFKEYSTEFGTATPEGHPRETYPKLTPDDVKTWAFYMRNLLDTKMAEVVAGSAKLPTIDEIRKWPGRRLRDPLNDGQQTSKTEEESRLNNYGLYPFADEVLAEAKK